MRIASPGLDEVRLGRPDQALPVVSPLAGYIYIYIYTRTHNIYIYIYTHTDIHILLYVHGLRHHDDLGGVHAAGNVLLRGEGGGHPDLYIHFQEIIFLYEI